MSKGMESAEKGIAGAFQHEMGAVNKMLSEFLKNQGGGGGSGGGGGGDSGGGQNNFDPGKAMASIEEGMKKSLFG